MKGKSFTDVVVRTANHALLYDTGPPFGPRADSGERIIGPYLRAVGVRRLDAMVVSHDDNDHTGGALSVLQALPVAWLASSLAETDPLPLLADRAYRCIAGQSWQWDGVRFDMIYPNAADYLEKKENNRSCVLKIAAPGGSVILSGDIEKRAEGLLVAGGVDLAADVLVAPHHGSKTSSTQPFIQAVGAKSVIFPVGYRNRLGHPHPEVVERYRASGSTIYRTDRDGALLLSLLPEQGIVVQPYRGLHRRYWLDAPHASDNLLQDSASVSN